MDNGRDVWFDDLIASADPVCPAEPMEAEHPLFLLYSSGSTAKPKGLVHTTGGYLTGVATTAAMGFDLDAGRGTGRIVNVSSVIGETGNIGQVNYAASKSGLFGLTKSLAREAIFQLDRAGHPPGDGDGVTVNAVTPGFVATDMLTGMPDKALDRVRGQIPLGRLGRPEEVARVVSFLAAEESAYITGQVWAVNGGLDM